VTHGFNNNFLFTVFSFSGGGQLPPAPCYACGRPCYWRYLYRLLVIEISWNVDDRFLSKEDLEVKRAMYSLLLTININQVPATPMARRIGHTARIADRHATASQQRSTPSSCRDWMIAPYRSSIDLSIYIQDRRSLFRVEREYIESVDVIYNLNLCINLFHRAIH